LTIKKLIIFNPSIEDGGVEKNLFLVANYLAKKIPYLTLITSSTDKKKFFSDKITFSTVYFKFFVYFKRYPKYLFCILLLIFNIIKYKRKVVVFAFQANIYAIIISKLLGVNVISRSNTSPHSWNKSRIKQLIFKFFFRRADLIIVNSSEFKKQIDKKYSIKSKIILNPFDFNYIKRKSLEKIKNNFFKKNSLKLITVGRLVDQKDQIIILKAIKLVLKKNKNIQLIIVGKGEKRTELNEYISRNKLEGYVKLVGYQNNPFKYISSADLFILSSKFEGLPNALIESMFLKKSVISSDCPTGPKEILNNGNYGSLFKVGDYKSLAKLILIFKKNKKKIENAFLSCSKYSYKNNCEEYFKTIGPYLK
jgi:glycosyltransferase involved in cell wall biosynthesis